MIGLVRHPWMRDFAEVQHCQGEILVFHWCASVCSANVLSHFSPVWLFATPWSVARRTPLSLGFFKQEYWSGLPCPSPGDLPNPEIESGSPAASALKADLYRWTTGEPWLHWSRKKKKTLYPLEEAGPCHPSNKATEHRAELAGNSVSQEAEE